MTLKVISTRAYVSALREMTEQGHEVQMTIAGGSMLPFLADGRDAIAFRKPTSPLKVGDMVFYVRSSGQYVMHRLRRIRPEGLYIVGDAQTVIEGPVPPEQVFAVVTKVRRKGKWIGPGNFWWEFFRRIWIRIVPLRPAFLRIYSIFRHKK